VPFALRLTGTVVSADTSSLAVRVSTSQAWPSNLTLTKLNRTITLTVSETALVQTVDSAGLVRTSAGVSVATKGQKVVVWTQPAPATLKAQRADNGVLTAALVQLSG
jgi:hypothetical protein